MPNLYNGVGDNASIPAAVNIASSTNASPIVVTTSTPHLLTEGDEIIVSGHAVNTAANGVWYAHILSSTQVALLVPVTRGNSTGNGVGAATGTVQSQNLSPTYNEPSDGDAASAASVNVALSALGDRTAWLSQRVGSYKTIFWGSGGPFDQAENPPGTLASVTSTSYTTGGLTAGLITVPTANFVANDILIVRGSINMQFATGASGSGVVVKPQLFYNSTANDFSTAQHLQVLYNDATSVTRWVGASLLSTYTFPANTSIQGSLSLVLNARLILGSNTVTIFNSTVLEMTVLRAN